MLHTLELGNWQWVLAAVGVFMIGMGKAGLKGMDMLSVTLMAIAFTSKGSTGVVLPLLCLADIAAVWYYKRHVRWEYFFRLIPWMVIGILIGVWTGNQMAEIIFRKMMAAIILITILLVVVVEFRLKHGVSHHPVFAGTVGLMAGFTTMMGNLAGAFANIYFLAMRTPKNDFIGTTAWIFLCVNLFKLPLQVFVWKNIHLSTLTTDLFLIPVLGIGFWTGLRCVGILQEQIFRKVVIGLTILGGVIMLMRN